MIKAIVQIGDMIKRGILQKFAVEKGTNLISLNFKTDSVGIEVKIDRELTSEYLAKTGYMGVQRGSGKEYSVIFPEDKLQYIGLKKPVSRTKFSLWNIKEELEKNKEQMSLAGKIEFIISVFYDYQGEKYHLKQSDAIFKEIKSISGDAPYYIQICIDGNPLWKYYKHRSAGETIKSSVRCLACGKDKVLKEFDTNQLKFLKFFGKDKLGFFPDFSSEYQWKVLPLCPDCAESVVLADTFLKESGFNIKIAGQLNLLIIPDIPGWQNFSQTFIKRTFDKLIEATNVLAGWSKLSQFDVYVERIFHTDEISIHIAINVYDGKTLKIYSSMDSIPPSRIRRLAMALKNASIFFSDHINVSLSLKVLYRLLSGKAFTESKKTPLLKEKFAELFKALLSGDEFPDLNLIKPGLELARWQCENEDVVKWSSEWIRTIKVIEGFLLVKRIMAGSEFNGGGENMSSVLEEAKRHVSDLPIYKEETGKIREGLFFLGYIIAQIASKQREKGLKDTILDKLQFRGMNKDQVMRLYNQVFDYMRIYDLQRFSENSEILGRITLIFDRSFSKWNLSPEETVYFILSGYAFLTSKLISKGKEKAKKEEAHE